MSFWELLAIVLSAAGVFASILGAFLTYAARKNGEATRELIRRTGEATQELIRGTTAATHELIRDLNRGMEERLATLLERMDLRADERHREVIEAIRTLRD